MWSHISRLGIVVSKKVMNEILTIQKEENKKCQ